MDRLDADEKGRSLIPTLGGQQEMLMASPSPMGVTTDKTMISMLYKRGFVSPEG